MKKRKGFTLIELLAVIVILGLLMAIAIPSVTKYITESRKKSTATTLSNYISAVINEVNDMEYIFTDTNTIYAVPIECIALERGGTNPFGKWHQASNNYWAYVLVKYDDINSKYIYGFTFKDSAGYGLYPKIESMIKENGEQIKVGLDLNRPRSGPITSLTTLERWEESGFDVDVSTYLQVLVSESEGVLGDGKKTCTLQQKGDNYDEVEAEKEQEKLLGDVYALILDNSDSSTNPKPMVFVKSMTELKVNDTYTSSIYGNRKILYAYSNFVNSEFSYISPSSNAPWANQASLVSSVYFEHTIKPKSLSAWFAGFTNARSFDVSNLDVSDVENMMYTFAQTGTLSSITSFSITGLNRWDTSKVKNMTGMFFGSGSYASSWSIGNISNWDVNSVQTMEGMFASAAYRASYFELDFSGWNVTSVENASNMFAHMGRNATSLSLKGLYAWNTKNIIDMSSMFYCFGLNASYSLDVSMWDVSKVVNSSNFNGNVTSKVKKPSF